jgi:hypothetical protein
LTRGSPSAACVEIVFRGRLALGGGEQVALEDYARALARAEGAEVVPAAADPRRVAGVHLCAPAIHPGGAVSEDVEAFAREMAERTGEGLGWS